MSWVLRLVKSDARIGENRGDTEEGVNRVRGV